MNSNAIDMLTADHMNVRALLQELVETSNRATKKRRQLLEKIGQELRLHTEIEDAVFYPAFRKAGKKDSKPIYFEAKEEHRAVERLILPDLEKTALDSDEFCGRAKVLQELVEHHANEEESEMFPRAEALMSEEQLQKLGEEMQQMKNSRKH